MSAAPSSDSKVKVAIRVRPFNRREIDLGTLCVVEVNDNQICLKNPSSIPISSSKNMNGDTNRNVKQFAFDNCFWSFDERDAHFATQEKVYHELGLPVLESSFQGYNACIFAYGQTGSGKSYTMMGSPNNKGLIPRLCDGIFERIAGTKDPNVSFKVEVSYMEIYNEKVHDLLDPRGLKQNLRVREHNILGPYVDGLSKLAVSSFEQIDNLMTEGNKSRTVAATNMNSESSRSHAVFTITLTCLTFDADAGVTGEKVSKMSLVDLAGSERAVKTGAMGDRLKEGSNINKSLTTLGLVISKLADASSGKSKSEQFVPYRDSVLTWLLKDNLGGNSKTVMVATISPAADNFDESLSTLRYADRAKRIVNHAVINEDPNARMIRELKEEVEMLREQLKNAAQQDDLRERLVESEKLIKEISQTWEEKLRRTEQIHQERQQALEKMGISVQSSGIKVETDKYYLVNLNSDPSLNELLVYYLKDKTLVGRSDAQKEQDIQLSGIGIQDEHCFIEIDKAKGELYLVPFEGARNCVNGSVVTERTLLRHGDRILWGNNHFFKVSCPRKNGDNSSRNSSRTSSTRKDNSTKSNLVGQRQMYHSSSPMRNSPDSSSTTTDDEALIDFEFAREELMMKELSNDPIQSTMKALEKQHEKDKIRALEKQKEMYEKQLQVLRNQMSPTHTPFQQMYDPYGSRLNINGSNVQSKMDRWAKERDELFKKSLAKLKEDIVRANSLVLEANAFSHEMGRQTEFKVTLQIPAANLSPNRKRGAFVSEPAILVKRKNKASQVWSMDKMENKLIDMREFYTEWKENGCPQLRDQIPSASDPFFETGETHLLIGVASIFLDVLFHDVTLDYRVPIINQQGEVAGRLHVEISRIGGQMGERMADANDIDSEPNEANNSREPSPDSYSAKNQVAVRLSIKAARGLPISLSNYVFCQYMFWGCTDAIVVPVASEPRQAPVVKLCDEKGVTTCNFNHVKEFIVNLSEEFIEHCAEGALSIEVWGHRSAGFSTQKSGWEIAVAQMANVNKSLSDRWSELKRRIELWVEIHELNDDGQYGPVEVTARDKNQTGGVYQLRQGQQRRMLVRVNPVSDSGTLPIICEAITSVAIGAVHIGTRNDPELDSYQEDDLKILKEKWKDALDHRREYLKDQMQKIENKKNKTEEDEERQKKLLDQWVGLLEEEKSLDDPHSEIPGANSRRPSTAGMEPHIPVVFMDLKPDDINGRVNEVMIAGLHLILPKEHNSQFFSLPIVKYNEKEVSCIVVWDSSIHDSSALNRASAADEKISLIVRVSVRLSHPAVMDLILRKRISINVYKKQSITNMIKKRITRTDFITSTGASYEIVSSIPKESEDVEDRESLAALAASGQDNTFDGESYIEKYSKGVSAVEGILTLDKLRQEVKIKELIAVKNGNVVKSADTSVRKTISVPNFGLITAAAVNGINASTYIDRC